MSGYAEAARRELFRAIPALSALKGHARLEAEQAIENAVEDAIDEAIDEARVVFDGQGGP